MPLTINAPDIEDRLQREAARQGIAPADLAMHLLEEQLPQAKATPTKPVPLTEPAPFHATASVSQWKHAFLEWVQSHDAMNTPRLAPEAFERASFYEDDRHLKRSH